jgi:Skp family chaperone for outer membrane proteins
VFAQQPAGPAPQGAPATAAHKGKIAVINTAVLQQEIMEYKSRIESVNRQYEPRGKELQGEADRITALETTLRTQRQQLTAARVAEITEEIERKKRDYRRKAEDLEAEAQRTLTQVLGPIKEKLGKFLDFYTTKREIILLIDLANAAENNSVLWIDPRIDVTKDFISEYNKVNPVANAGGAPVK